MLSFSLWRFLSRLVQVAMLQGDKVIVARVGGAAGLASYIVPFGAAQRLNLLGSAAVTAVYPVAAGRSQSRSEFLESYFRAARVVHLFTDAEIDWLVRALASEGLQTLVRGTVRFNWHRELILALGRQPTITALLFRTLFR
jgi:hypothetical protein